MGKCYGTWHSTNRIYQNENNRLRTESESLLKVIELLPIQQINTHEANNNTENFIAVKRTGKNKNSTEEFIWNSSQWRIPGQTEPNDKEKSMLPSFDHTPSQTRQKKQSTKHNEQLEANILTTNMKNPLYRGKYVEYRVGEHMWQQPSLESKLVSLVIAT